MNENATDQVTNPAIHYVNPAELCPSPRLDDLLILLPSYSGPGLSARSFLDELVSLGANIVASYGVSDVALHRCIVAGRALRALRDERLASCRFVLWLDDDMVATAAHVAFLREVVRELSNVGKRAAVTGVYCKRGNSGQVTLRQNRYEESLAVFVSDANGLRHSVELHPVFAGMGCLMLERRVFEEHCAGSVQFAPTRSGDTLPAICASGPMHDESGDFGWISEDQCYCLGLWTYADGVYSAPVAFAHMSLVPLVPKKDADWLSEKPVSPTLPAPPLDDVGG